MKKVTQTPEWVACRQLMHAFRRRVLKLSCKIGRQPRPDEWELYHESKLKQLQDYHSGEDCFVIGNGPSLNFTDLSRLSGKHVFGLNKIHMIFKSQPIELSYLVACNSHVIEQSADVYREMNNLIFLARSPACEHSLFTPNILHLREQGRMGLFSRELFGNLSQGSTVTYFALQIAFAMGFKRVFLIGVDHSFSQAGQPNETQRLEGEDPNHFDPNYFKGHQWQLADLAGSELSYQAAKYHYNLNSREIIDATIGGKLQIFPKIEYEKAVAECKDKIRPNFDINLLS